MRFLRIILPLALFATAQLRADSVTLVTGEKVTGTIKDETPSEITIDVPVSASITDERVIRKEDIAKIEKEQPDAIAAQQLLAIPASDGLSYSSQTYGQILASLNAFLAKYPTSTYAPQIQKLADGFSDEKKRVDAGQIKYLGQWLSRDEATRRQIQIVALQYYNTMQQQAAAGDLVEAMKTFDTIERDYATTRSYPSAVTLAQEILLRFQQDLVVRMQEVKDDQAQLQKTVAFTQEPEKSRIIASAKAEQDRADGIVLAASKSGSKWVPLIPRNLSSIASLQTTVASESTRVAAIPVATMNQSIEKADAARNAISTGDFKTASSLIDDATKLWASNEAAHYWGDRLKEKMATPIPTPTPAATAVPLPAVARPAPQIAAATPMPAAASSDDKPFYMTIQGAIAIAAGVLIVGGLLASYGQKKARQRAAAAE